MEVSENLIVKDMLKDPTFAGPPVPSRWQAQAGGLFEASGVLGSATE